MSGQFKRGNFSSWRASRFFSLVFIFLIALMIAKAINQVGHLSGLVKAAIVICAIVLCGLIETSPHFKGEEETTYQITETHLELKSSKREATYELGKIRNIAYQEVLYGGRDALDIAGYQITFHYENEDVSIDYFAEKGETWESTPLATLYNALKERCV